MARFGLSALRWPYGLGTWLRNRGYDVGWLKAHKAPVPVVSIGNLTLGGTGKTPAVEYVARFYREMELRVAILSRGYGNANGRNDEALVLESNLPDVPHLQGKDRLALARTACTELDSEVLVLDDGFQHRRLHRDLDVVLIDVTNPWGYNRLFPRGLLRESPASLRRAQVALLTRCDQVLLDDVVQLRRAVRGFAAGLPVVESRHAPRELVNSLGEQAELERLRGVPVAGVCGIGNPEGFRRTLLDLGARMLAWRTFPDHHAYTRSDVDQLRAWARQLPAEALIVTTQKDLVKLAIVQLGGRPLWAVRIALELTEGMETFNALLKGVIE
jgi:tetraacyldisaccharide 4'-kinase